MEIDYRTSLSNKYLGEYYYLIETTLKRFEKYISKLKFNGCYIG